MHGNHHRAPWDRSPWGASHGAVRTPPAQAGTGPLASTGGQPGWRASLKVGPLTSGGTSEGAAPAPQLGLLHTGEPEPGPQDRPAKLLGAHAPPSEKGR